MKKIIFLLLLLPIFANAQMNYDSLYSALHIQYNPEPIGFTRIILPIDTSFYPIYGNKVVGSMSFLNNKLYVNNGVSWGSIGSQYYAGFGLYLHIDTFKVDTSKIVTHFSLNDSLANYATLIDLHDTAISLRTYTGLNLGDTAAVLRTYATSQINDTAIAMRTYFNTNINDTATSVRSYSQTNLADTASAIRSAIPSLTGYATTTALNDTAINVRSYVATNLADTATILRGLIPTEINDSAINIRSYTGTNLTDTATSVRGYSQTNLSDTSSTLRTWANGKFSTTTGTVTSVGAVAGTGITIGGTSPITSSGTFTISGTGSLTAGTGISVGGSFPTYTVTNTAPNQTVSLNAGTGISIGGSYPTYTVTNASPNQTVNIAAGTGATVTGSYPSYTVAATGSGGTVTSVGLVAGTGMSVTGSSPITGSGTFTVVNTSPDQTVSLNAGKGINVAGSYPTFTVSGTGSLTAGSGINVSGSFPTYTVTNSSPSSGGTVTSVGIAAGTGISVSGSPITSSGVVTVTATGSLTAGTGMSVSGSFPTYTVTNTSAGGGGTVTSLQVVSNLSAFTVTPTSAVTSTGVYSLVAASTNKQLVLGDGSSGITNFTTSGGEVLMGEHVYSASPSAPSSGSGLPWMSNANGRDELHILPPSGYNDFPVQAAVKQERIAHMIPTPSTLLYDDFYTSNISSAGTLAVNTISYDATNLAPNRLYYKLTGTAAGNVSVEWRYSGVGGDALIGNNNYGAGSQLTILCYLPGYVSTQRFFAGFTSSTAAISASSDPSSVLNIVGVGKDAADGTLQIMFNNGSGTATKVNTGITPTVNDEYMIVVTIPPNGASETVYLERRTKSAVTTFSATNTSKVPSAQTLMYMHLYSNSAGASTAPVIAVGRITDEEFY